jgi:hypothetical protein
MDFKGFFDFGWNCPSCDNNLSLYFQISGGSCFKLDHMRDNKYLFLPLFSKDYSNNPENAVQLKIGDDNRCELFCKNYKILDELKNETAYLFFLCKEQGFKLNGDNKYAGKHNQDYEINLYKGCYYRASPILYLSDNFILETLEAHKDLTNGDEVIALNRMSNGDLFRVYMLHVCYENNSTIMYYYSCTPEQSANKEFIPNILEKSLPIPRRKLDFSLKNRDKLLNKLDNWILMS